MINNPLELLKKSTNPLLKSHVERFEKASQKMIPINKKPIKKNHFNSDLSTHEDTESSDNETDNEDAQSQNVQDVQLEDVFKEKVIKYIKIDDSIRTKKTEILELKKELKPCEDYIMKYLDTRVEDETEKKVNIDDSVIAKSSVSTKAPLTIQLVKTSIVDGLRKAGFNDEAVIINLTNTISEIIEEKRKVVVKTRTGLKRRIKTPRKPKPRETKSAPKPKIDK